eukprot:CAMPEP_0171208628 /NCGR_PEP_ID=MMETSP0790-20130122/28184_1 /TAXON_ID=2925 /ORGANISM="Alexandrium catenella, Strain OF101" /LENGTH=321 /DNA_ID=CAMNT_0011674225 /DNA_START=1 /DNA_END=963 /DNA_ORIENTATION=-
MTSRWSSDLPACTCAGRRRAARRSTAGDSACWDEIYNYEVCCTPDEEVSADTRRRFALQVAHHLWKRSLWYGLLEPASCHRDERGLSVPGLPDAALNGTIVTAVAPGNLVAVVMTRLAELGPEGRAAGLAATWAARLPAGSVALAMEDVEVPAAQRPPNLEILRIACPEYWILDCNTYTASIYLGHYGLRRMLRLHPLARWFLISDDDLYLNPYALSVYLRRFNFGTPVCVGSYERSDRPLLSYWSGIVCSNAAVRLLDHHLEGATREVVRTRLGYSAGDFIISKCLRDLKIPMIDLPGFFGGNWPFEGGAKPSASAATFH